MNPTRDIFVQDRVLNGKRYIAKDYKVILLDDIGEIIWNSLDGTTSFNEIAETITSEYNVEKEVVIEDIKVFVNKLYDKGFIEYE
ncbi:PqqD family protein [Lysinibacillus sp. FSL M8-0134]|uniref:PqqD family protein n=1 Tax=Lysinibacillus sp. FSL M8-0134 TaxID=2921717 RepID=UPI0031191DB8